MIQITTHGHACFTLQMGQFRTVLDPYRDGMVDGLPALQLEAEAVLCSHGHDDHGYVQVVKLNTAGNAPYALEVLESYHDDREGALRGRNRIHVFSYEGLRVAHLGDQGAMPSQEILEKLHNIDCVLIPVGGTFTLDPLQAKAVADAIDATVTIPMHYRTDTAGFDVLAHLNEFTGLYENVATCDNTFELTKDARRQILVINYKP